MRRMTLLLVCLARLAWAQPQPLAAFGKSVRWVGSSQQRCWLQSDFDGDGRKDHALLVEVVSQPPASVVQTSLAPLAKQFAPPRKGELGLAVVLQAKGKAKPYLLRYPELFSTPIWKEGKFKSLVTLGTGPQPPVDAKGQSIGLGTESGALWYVHWNGKQWTPSTQGDEP